MRHGRGAQGELIFGYILEQAMSAAKRSKTPMTRLWLSSLTESAIRHAFKNRRVLTEYDNLYAAARCRSEADWIVGMNATRNYTVRFGQSGVLWSVGRCANPSARTLGQPRRRDQTLYSCGLV